MRHSILVAALTLSLAACGDPEPVKIGFIGGLEGRASDIGIASRNAVQMAVDEVNAGDGIDGRKIELLVRDDEGTENGGAKAAQSLIAEGIDAIIGPNLSVVASGLLPEINKSGIVTISPTVSSLAFVGKNDHFYRIGSTTGQYAASYARYCINAGYRTVGAALDKRNALFSNSWLKEFRSAFGALGGTVVAALPFDNTVGGEFSRVADALLASRADALIFIANGVDSAQIAQQIRKRSSDVGILAAEWAASESLIALGGSAVEGMVLLQTYDRYNESARYVAFRDAYRERFRSEPGFSSIAAYDGISYLFAALRERAGDTPLKSVMDMLPPVQGLQQSVSFDKFGDSARLHALVSIQNGKFIVK
tara:strand:- start:552 stop:1646 length:1095 start_codon:yes stop_codon:yes gene_type:complete